MTVVGPDQVASYVNLYFSTTNTLRGYDIDLNSIEANYIINVDGKIYLKNEPSKNYATVKLVGGLSSFVNEKQPSEPYFYMSDRQKVTIYNILKAVAGKTDRAEISSTVQTLDYIVSSTYRNYCG